MGETKSNNGNSPNNSNKFLSQVVVRHLPPTMTAEQFINEISPVPDHNYFHLLKPDMSLGQWAFTRACINFTRKDDIFVFKDKFDGYVFVDANGTEYPASVEFSPYQKVPRRRMNSKGEPLSCKKRDPKCGTIEEDPDYKTFIESLNDPENQKNLPSAEVYLEEIEAREKEIKANHGVVKLTTPLIEFIKQKKAEKLRLKEERREERKRQQAEQKKAKDEEKKNEVSNNKTSQFKVKQKDKKNKGKEGKITIAKNEKREREREKDKEKEKEKDADKDNDKEKEDKKLDRDKEDVRDRKKFKEKGDKEKPKLGEKDKDRVSERSEHQRERKRERNRRRDREKKENGSKGKPGSSNSEKNDRDHEKEDKDVKKEKDRSFMATCPGDKGHNEGRNENEKEARDSNPRKEKNVDKNRYFVVSYSGDKNANGDRSHDTSRKCESIQNGVDKPSRKETELNENYEFNRQPETKSSKENKRSSDNQRLRNKDRPALEIYRPRRARNQNSGGNNNNNGSVEPCERNDSENSKPERNLRKTRIFTKSRNAD